MQKIPTDGTDVTAMPHAQTPWHLCWLAKAGWEANYVPHQLLGSVPIVDRSFAECRGGVRRNHTILVIRNAGRSLGGDPSRNLHEVEEYARLSLRFAVVILNDENLVKHPCGWPERPCSDAEAVAFNKRPSPHRWYDHLEKEKHESARCAAR